MRADSNVRFWRIAAALLALWAVVATALLVASRSEPVLAVAEGDGTQALSDFEAVSFVRELAERYLSFDSHTFHTSQSAVAFLMNEELRERRLKEIDRLSEKIQRQNVRQRGVVLSIHRLGERTSEYEVRASVTLLEGDKAHQPSEFQTTIRVLLDRVARSIENPWGLQFVRFDQKVGPIGLVQGAIALEPKLALVMHFPCPVENVELSKGTSLKVKLTTLDTSELQVRTDAPFFGEQAIRATCRDREFSQILTAGTGSEAALVYRSFAASDGLNLDDQRRRPRKKTAVERTLEEQLGFVTEDPR